MEQFDIWRTEDHRITCAQGVHVLPSAKRKDTPRFPECIYCGDSSVDWTRARRLDLNDLPWKLRALQSELCRRVMWDGVIDDRAVLHARRKGRAALEPYVRRRIESSLGRVFLQKDGVKRPFRDGFQTPYAGNIVYYAQHATASCCRKCTWRWHGIEQFRDLRSDEIDYLSALILAFIDHRLPHLVEAGEKISPLRRAPRRV